VAANEVTEEVEDEVAEDPNTLKCKNLTGNVSAVVYTGQNWSTTVVLHNTGQV